MRTIPVLRTAVRIAAVAGYIHAMQRAAAISGPRATPIPKGWWVVAAEANLANLIARVQAGDQQAAAELVAEYEPEIRRYIRVRLTEPRLRRLLDSQDICQSVLGDFFLRVAEGRFEATDRRQLIKFFMVLAKNKLVDQARRQHARRRYGPTADDGAEWVDQVADSASTPSRQVAAGELAELVVEALPENERYLVQERVGGRDWGDLAHELGAQPDALRKRFTRALEKAANYLGLTEAKP
jgi:RNA polymerase sigma factor (sigma-70 family)